jgi:hypothetical protein
MAEPRVKTELAADLERARARLAGNFAALRRDVDVPTILKHSYRQNKAAFIGGATLFGLLLSKLPARRKKVYIGGKVKEGVREAEKAGLWLVVLQFLFKTLRPMLTSLLSKQVADFVKSRAGTKGER